MGHRSGPYIKYVRWGIAGAYPGIFESVCVCGGGGAAAHVSAESAKP